MALTKFSRPIWAPEGAEYILENIYLSYDFCRTISFTLNWHELLDYFKEILLKYIGEIKICLDDGFLPNRQPANIPSNGDPLL